MILIEVRTEYNLENYNEFNRFHLFTKNRFFLIIFSLLFIVIGLLFLPKSVFIALSFFIFALLFPCILWILIPSISNSYLRSNKMIGNAKNVYFRFEETSFYNEIRTDDLQTSLEVGWSKIYTVAETKNYFFIYSSKLQAFVIAKTDFVNGSSQDLQVILSRKAKEGLFRYKKYYRKV